MRRKTIAATAPIDEAQILASAYAERVQELFKIFAEAVNTGEPERDAVVKFRRALLTARRVYAAAVDATREPNAA